MGKNKGVKTNKLARRATFIRGKTDLDKSTLTVQPRTLNVVHKVNLKAGAPNVRGGPTVYFKPHSDQTAATQYAVASTRLARFLHMDEVIAHNAFARVNSTPGAVSGEVPGLKLVAYKHDKPVPVPAEWQDDIAGWMRYKQIEMRGGIYYAPSQEIYQWVNFKDPRIQKGLSDLQLFDAITGQKDRHGGNIFINPATGQVSGIDDDQSFGQGIAVSSQAEPRDKYTGLPDLVDRGTAEKILAMKPDDLREQLEAAQDDTKPLTDKEINDAVQRLANVQSYLRLLGDQLVDTWNDATYEKARRTPSESYLGRQAQLLDEAIDKAATDPEFAVLNAPPTVPPLPALPPPPPPPIPHDLPQLQPQQVVRPPLRPRGAVAPPMANVLQPATNAAMARQQTQWVPAVPKT